MQTVTTQFEEFAKGEMRPINWLVDMSFEKTIDPDIAFFTVESSPIESGDYIKPDESDVIQEWNQYLYTNISDRVINVEWSRQVNKLASVTTAIADVTFDNSDDYFTPNSTSPVSEYILPRRPIRIFSGFKNELIQSFAGITYSMPIIDSKNKTASFHCIDFLSSVFERELTETQFLTDVRTDEVLTTLFTNIGVSSEILDFDEALITIPFVYFQRGETLGAGVKKLMEAEQGRLYMDSIGNIVFRNRESYDTTVRYNFDMYTNIIDIATRSEDELINVVNIVGKVREVQANAEYYSQTVSTQIDAGKTIDIWVSFDDPVFSVDTPLYEDDAITSSFSVNTDASGGGSANSTDVTLTGFDAFSQSVKMTFRNSGGATLYITNITLWASVAEVIQNINVREDLEDSIEKYDEHLLEIDNDFYQDQNDARLQALIILGNFGDYGDIYQMEVKGSMALQLDDIIKIEIGDSNDLYQITKIENTIENPVKFKQILKVKKFIPLTYFTVPVSLITGTDKLKP